MFVPNIVHFHLLLSDILFIVFIFMLQTLATPILLLIKYLLRNESAPMFRWILWVFQRLRNCCRYKLNKSYLICSKLKSIIPFYYSRLRSKPFYMQTVLLWQKFDRLFFLHLVLLTFYFRNSLICCTVSTDFPTMIEFSFNNFRWFFLCTKNTQWA